MSEFKPGDRVVVKGWIGGRRATVQERDKRTKPDQTMVIFDTRSKPLSKWQGPSLPVKTSKLIPETTPRFS